MPFHAPQYPWLDIDHDRGKISCTRCDAGVRFGRNAGLEVLMDRLRPFAQRHATCAEPRDEEQGFASQEEG